MLGGHSQSCAVEGLCKGVRTEKVTVEGLGRLLGELGGRVRLEGSSFVLLKVH